MPPVTTLLVAILTVTPVAHPTTSSPVMAADVPHAAATASTQDGEPNLGVPPTSRNFSSASVAPTPSPSSSSGSTRPSPNCRSSSMSSSSGSICREGPRHRVGLENGQGHSVQDTRGGSTSSSARWSGPDESWWAVDGPRPILDAISSPATVASSGPETVRPSA
jgi:hypothetical protein